MISFNMLLERYPVEYKGYLIRTDFRVGIKIVETLDDLDLEEDDRTLNALYLLYGNGVPDDINIALGGLKWFLSGGSKDDKYVTKKDIEEEKDIVLGQEDDIPYDFTLDAQTIYSSMYSQYGIQLNKIQMHWFEFLALFKGLKDTQMNDLMYYRTLDLSKVPNNQRKDYKEIKDKVKLNKVSAARKEQLITVFGEDWMNHI